MKEEGEEERRRRAAPVEIMKVPNDVTFMKLLRQGVGMAVKELPALI